MATSRKRTLHNGIRLPAVWPPRRKAMSHAPQGVPCLTRPPAVVGIDVGRQLFVDDFLIERTTLQRTFHPAEYHPACPVLTETKRWERDGKSFWAAPFSDGVWYDPADGRFKMWYLAGACTGTCYAESRDGVRWFKPSLDVHPGTNIVLSDRRDSMTVWLDHEEANPRRRFKMLYLGLSRRKWHLILRFSPDGIHWSRPAAVERCCGDRSTFYRDLFRGVWVYSLRWFPPLDGMTPMRLPKSLGRIRGYREHADLVRGLRNCDRLAVPWLGADRLDPHHPNPKYNPIVPQLYNFDAAPYESIMLGQYSVWMGPENDESARVGNHKRCEVFLGFSRDGFHFARPHRRPFIGVDEVDGAWNWGNVQSAGGGCLVVGDKLHFYVSGRALDASGRQGNMSTGLATLRRDGFASVDAGEKTGTLTTRPLWFSGAHLFVNADIRRGGELRVETLDRRGNVIAPFTRAHCIPAKANKTRMAVKWKEAGDLSALAGKPVRFRFRLRNGRLYSFWVSPGASGVSNGYVAAGGPGFSGPTDKKGSRSLFLLIRLERFGGRL